MVWGSVAISEGMAVAVGFGTNVVVAGVWESVAIDEGMAVAVGFGSNVGAEGTWAGAQAGMKTVNRVKMMLVRIFIAASKHVMAECLIGLPAFFGRVGQL